MKHLIIIGARRSGREVFEKLTGFKFETPPGYRWDAIMKGLGERRQRL